MPSFADNMRFFEGLHRAHRCLLNLSLHGVIALRVRVIDQSVLIEIDRPLEVQGLDVGDKQGYAVVVFYSCSVVWRQVT